MTQRPTQLRLELEKLVKSFPGCLANDRVDLKVLPGEIHALLGENGAGKSTLVKMIFGLLQPDAGTMRWEGRPIRLRRPAEARALGIAMVFQHFSLFDALSVKENIALGLDRPPPMRHLERRILEVEERYGLPLDPNRAVHSLSVGEKQRIEIVRSLLQEPRLLIMDEPTSVLTPPEVSRLFVTLRRLRAEGVSVLYISHKLEEVRGLCDRATLLRRGRNVALCRPAEETVASLAALMVGERVAEVRPQEATSQGPVRLELQGLSRAVGSSHRVSLKDIQLQLRAGEILGIAGVAGNGQTELLEALSGEWLASPGQIFLDGCDLSRQGPAQRRRRGLCFVPEERLGQGAVPGMSLADNALLSGYSRPGLLRRGLVQNTALHHFASEVIERFDVRGASDGATAASLSGGNLQKFIVGREVQQTPEVLVVAQPTWGVDAGAAALIHQSLQGLASRGCAVLLISQDLDELMLVSHRVGALCGGRLSPCYPRHALSQDDLGLLMTGMTLETPGVMLASDTSESAPHAQA